MPSWRHYARALYVFQMSWHCAPLKYEGAISLSGKPMRGKPQSVSNQKGSSPCLQSEDCWSQSPICWPLVTVSNLLTRTNNRWLAYRTVIIARWYICLSVMQCPQYPFLYSINFNLIQYFNLTFHVFHNIAHHNLKLNIYHSFLFPSFIKSLSNTIPIYIPSTIIPDQYQPQPE